MENRAEKPIAKVVIEYSDGTKESLDRYALVGVSGHTWHSVMLSPASEEAKVKMNNYMVELSEALRKDIQKQSLAPV